MGVQFWASSSRVQGARRLTTRGNRSKGTLTPSQQWPQCSANAGISRAGTHAQRTRDVLLLEAYTAAELVRAALEGAG